jgi:hypothetical protein
LLLSILFIACRFGPATADIIVHNSSDYDVTNISIGYYHETKGAQNAAIDLLPKGEERGVTVEMRDTYPLQTFVQFISLEYYINDIKFDVNNEIGAHEDDDGDKHTNAVIGTDLNAKIIITNDGYKVD